ncbi:MAG: hypothetical protein GZ094_03675 [Mariniphaga sp.]|nr:hypothetical protein [Mariniphaga sp.]
MNKFTLLSLMGVLLVSACANEPKTDAGFGLPKEWKFITGDSTAYSDPAFNDTKWKILGVDSYWEKQGYQNYDGIGWYRTRVVIPSSFKLDNQLFKSVRISLGKIDDSDDTYLNGQRIGGATGWDTQRVYAVPFDLIRWDQENIIAVRVNDLSGNGGMWGAEHTIGDMNLGDVLYLQTSDAPSKFTLETTSFHKTVYFKFKIPIDSIQGTLNVKVYQPTSKAIIFQKEYEIVVGSKADSLFNTSVEIKEPNFYKVDFSFTAKSLIDTIKNSSLLAYVLNPRTNEQAQTPLVTPTIAGKSLPFALENIAFGGYLNERLNANLFQRLLNIDETGILECYYNRPGNQTWVGEYSGKYLHAASRVWRSTNNAQLKAQMDRIVDILIACQNEDGYLGTYLPSTYWTDWDVWAHKYNMLGLLSYYSVTGYKPALETSKKMGDLLCKTFGENPGQRNIINSSGHIGMASTSVLKPMTELYRFTGDKKYLDFCFYILKAYDYENGPKVVSTLATLGKVDKTANGKAYEMTSNLTGIVKLYQLTGDEKLLKAAKNAWNDISTYKLYITGTASEHELYREDFYLPAENEVNMGEGCVTTTWIQFSQAMYNLTGEPKYMDEIEKSVYNHLFAAENPQTGCVSYYTALQGKKPYRCNIDAHCCLASIPRGIAAIPELALTKNTKNGLNVNLYSAEKLNDKIKTKGGKEVQVNCSIQTDFPSEGKAVITISSNESANFNLALRVPIWCKNFKAIVDGKTLDGIPGQYLNIEKEWDKESTIRVSFDLTVQALDGGKSYPGFIAVKVGPQVLAVDQALNPDLKDLDKVTMGPLNLTPISKSVLPKGWVGSQVYKTKAFYSGKPIELKVVPFADAGQTDGDIRVWIRKR